FPPFFGVPPHFRADSPHFRADFPPFFGVPPRFRALSPDVEDLLRFLRPLHEGTLVLVASYDDPATKLTEETRRLFGELGQRRGQRFGFRDSWVFVGAKGVQDRSPFEQHVRNSRGSNKYEGWPEALELGGCVPRRPPGVTPKPPGVTPNSPGTPRDPPDPQGPPGVVGWGRGEVRSVTK
ncbi:LOW QUALITY PROTEIN: protein FAM3A, partial [Aphelocoma coerulescens]|uniref:LOW QUALITY PROTEIN: protein FAM3A n=1 Tax=Aphelocoma coerulescens TaxID=39617 RepID=UPI00360477FB